MAIQGLIRKDILSTFDNYNPKMSVSKVVKFFERYDIEFTRTMLQNYVRIEILPPLLERRYYTKKHFVFLLIIETLKSTYTLNELKTIFEPLFYIEDDESYIRILNRFDETYNKSIFRLEDVLSKNMNEFNIDNNLRNFKDPLAILMLMSETAATKDLVDKCLE